MHSVMIALFDSETTSKLMLWHQYDTPSIPTHHVVKGLMSCDCGVFGGDSGVCSAKSKVPAEMSCGASKSGIPWRSSCELPPKIGMRRLRPIVSTAAIFPWVSNNFRENVSTSKILKRLKFSETKVMDYPCWVLERRWSMS